MKPFIPLAPIPSIYAHLCGDEDGDLLVVTDEFIADAIAGWESEKLVVVMTNASKVMMPIVECINWSEGSVAELAYSICEIELRTVIVDDWWKVRAGFCKEHLVWAVGKEDVQALQTEEKKDWRDHPYLKDEEALL